MEDCSCCVVYCGCQQRDVKARRSCKVLDGVQLLQHFCMLLLLLLLLQCLVQLLHCATEL
jgi:hypothetical protein